MQEGATGRDVYLPPGGWVDYQTGQAYSGGWHAIEAGRIPVVMLVRDGAAIPHAALAQSTMQIDWGHLELVVFSREATRSRALVSVPGDETLHALSLLRQDGG